MDNIKKLAKEYLNESTTFSLPAMLSTEAMICVLYEQLQKLERAEPLDGFEDILAKLDAHIDAWEPTTNTCKTCERI